ncbi:MAG TPA: hypothetical protein VNY31_09875 [Solirubrobacteraceae bacterium]|nr:hypothetical protein [Solirubrobacteraceae bacterium]
MLGQRDGTTTIVVRQDAFGVEGEHCSLGGRATDYKEAIRAALLPFPSAALYEQHLEVVRQLRKPKLSDELDPQLQELAAAIGADGCAVHEEALLDVLLDDLRVNGSDVAI